MKINKDYLTKIVSLLFLGLIFFSFFKNLQTIKNNHPIQYYVDKEFQKQDKTNTSLYNYSLWKEEKVESLPFSFKISDKWSVIKAEYGSYYVLDENKNKIISIDPNPNFVILGIENCLKDNTLEGCTNFTSNNHLITIDQSNNAMVWISPNYKIFTSLWDTETKVDREIFKQYLTSFKLN